MHKLFLKDINGLKEFKSRLSFVYQEDNREKFVCSCNKRFEKQIEDPEEFKEDQELTGLEEEYMEDFKTLMVESKFGSYGELKCPKCKKNFFIPEEKVKLLRIGQYFVSGFLSKAINKEEQILYFWKAKTHKPKNNVLSKIEYKAFHINGKSNSIDMFDNNGSKTKVTLANVIDLVENFFRSDIRAIINIQDLHIFLSEITKFVSDLSSIDIVSELLEPLRGRSNDMGKDYIKKMMTVFFSIICYSSMSTIAMTKGVNFLYDVLKECSMPDEETLESNGLTSPLDIFNFLSKSYVEKISNELIDGEEETYIYISQKVDGIKKHKYYEDKIKNLEKTQIYYEEPEAQEGVRVMKIKMTDQEKLDKMDKSHRASSKKAGAQNLDEEVSVKILDGTITKNTYNHLRTFSDYTQIVKLNALYSKNEVSDLLVNYNIKLLIYMVDHIYWRPKMSKPEFKRFASILTDYARIRTQEKIDASASITPDKAHKIVDDEIEFHFIREFDISFYNDCIMMLESLSHHWKKTDGEGKNPFTRSRYFDTIKSYSKLVKFHDNLVRQFNLISGNDDDDPYTKAVAKYAWIEDSKSYEGPIKVETLKTPMDFIKEGNIMKASAGIYGVQVIRGTYLVAKLLDTSLDIPEKEQTRFTIGFQVDRGNHLEFDQLKGHKNTQASDRVKMLVMEWMRHMDISFQDKVDIRFMGDGTLELDKERVE